MTTTKRYPSPAAVSPVSRTPLMPAFPLRTATVKRAAAVAIAATACLSFLSADALSQRRGSRGGSGSDAASKGVYDPADVQARPVSNKTEVLPQSFLRGYDPITVYFPNNVGPARGPADDGKDRLKITPRWPGAYQWLDKQTLQFRPAEPWPALSRFEVTAGRKRHVLTTMMSAPSAMSPPSGSTNIPAFRSFSLTFDQPLPLAALKKMVRVEVRQAPGLASSPRRVVKAFDILPLPRPSIRSPQTYAFTMPQAVEEGHELVVELALALDDNDRVMWQGRAATKSAFHLVEVSCNADVSNVSGGGGAQPERALDCGHSGEGPQLVFSAPPKNLTLSQLGQLVKLSPAVQDLTFKAFGKRIQLRGRFLPDVLYRMQLRDAPILDDVGRRLTSLTPDATPEVYFFLGYKRPFVRWSQGRGVLEANGPRMMPVRGYGDRMADVRIHRIDPRSTKLWPFPSSPIIINEERAPPFPGEEPGEGSLLSRASVSKMSQHIRLLGSPLVSEMMELPLVGRAGVTEFGLDLGQALDRVVGKNRPGHYLVGLRRVKGAPQRSWVRVQITNFTITSVEEGDDAVFFVRRLDTGAPVVGARVTLEGTRRKTNALVDTSGVTDRTGRVTFRRQSDWSRVLRISVAKGDDVLVLDPSEPPPSFANFHWSSYGQWLNWMASARSMEPEAKRIAFVVTDRPIYRPGDKVHIKAWVRNKNDGLLSPAAVGGARIRLKAPGGKSYDIAATISPLGGLSATFSDAKAPTGNYSATLLLKGEKWTIGERRFKIEAYRTPKFEVQLTSPRRVPLDGPFKVKAFARYYAGGNVAGANINWRVTERPYFHIPKGREGYIFASTSQFARSTSGQRRGSNQQSGTLDDSGAMSIEVNPALDMDGSARLYRFEATVTGADHQQVSSVTEVAALPAFTLGMKLPRFMKNAGDIGPKVIATGVNDQALAGKRITLKLFRRSWHSHLRETQFSTGEANYVTEQEDTLVLEKKIVTKDKPLSVSLPVNTSGVYVVELIARDKLGRVQTLKADLFVGGKEGVSWRKSQHGVFDLSTDKRHYSPGETAQLLVKSPFNSGEALVITEMPGGNTYRWVPVRGSKAVVPVKITAATAPNLPVHVVLMRGRLKRDRKAATKDDGRYRPQTVASSLDIKVRPVANQLSVEVEHPKTVQPGAKVPFNVTLKDPKGRPLAGEVTLWLVDEAVLSLAKEGPLNPLSQFVTDNRRRSAIRDTRNTVIGRLAEEEESPGGDGMEDSAPSAKRASGVRGGKSRRRVRRNFATVPYYAATLKIPSSGKLALTIPMSDDLTNFSVRAVAASGRGRFGSVEQRIRVRLPVIVQPQLPRFARQGDRFAIGGVARIVEGEGGKGTVDITVKGPVDGSIRPRTVNLDQKKATSVTWPVTIRSAERGATLDVSMGVTRKKDGVSDAFDVSVPIFPDRAVESTHAFFDLKQRSTTLPPFAESPRAGTVEQTLVVTPIDNLLPAALGIEVLVDYPHGCLEQKLSQLMPQVALASFASQVGLRRARPDVVETMAKVAKEMELHQAGDGLFSYWPGGPTDVPLTAQALEFLQMAKDFKVPFSKGMRDKATFALRRVLRSDYDFLRSYRYNQQTAALAALVRAGEVDEHYLMDLFHARKKMDATAAADLLRTFAFLPERLRDSLKSKTESLVDDVWSRVVFQQYKGKLRFERLESARDAWTFGYLGSSTASIAATLESLSLHDPKNPRLPLLRQALLARAGRNGFGTTHDNRRAVTALVSSLKSEGEAVAPVTISSASGQVRLDAKQKMAKLTLPEATKKLTKSGSGTTHALLRRRFLPQTPGDRVGSIAKGFIVTRAFKVLTKAGKQRRYEDERGQERELSAGDIVELSTTVVADEAHHHIALVVPFAAGLEPLNPELQGSSSEAKPSRADTRKPTYVQRLDHEVRYYFDYLPKGTHSFHFRTRATVEGSFTHPPPLAEGMYAPEIRGRGVGQRFIIAGAKGE